MKNQNGFTPLEKPKFNTKSLTTLKEKRYIKKNIPLNSLTGFTLVELLTVVAIIALLFGIIFAHMGGAREKAGTAKALHFSHSIQNALGDYAVGVWRFDDQGSNPTKDESGYGNDGILNGANYVSDTPSDDGWALDFNNDYVDCGNKSSLSLTKDITIEAWVKPNASGGTVVYKNFSYKISVAGDGTVQGDVGNGTGWSGTGGVTSNKKLISGNWHHLILTYSEHKQKMMLHIDGDRDSDTNWSGPLGSSNFNVGIGAADTGTWGGYFDGIIDEVRIYNKPLIY